MVAPPLALCRATQRGLLLPSTHPDNPFPGFPQPPVATKHPPVWCVQRQRLLYGPSATGGLIIALRFGPCLPRATVIEQSPCAISPQH